MVVFDGFNHLLCVIYKYEFVRIFCASFPVQPSAEGDELTEGTHAEFQELPPTNRHGPGLTILVSDLDLGHIVAILDHEDGEEQRRRECILWDEAIRFGPGRPAEDLEGDIRVIDLDTQKGPQDRG